MKKKKTTRDELRKKINNIGNKRSIQHKKLKKLKDLPSAKRMHP